MGEEIEPYTCEACGKVQEANIVPKAELKLVKKIIRKPNKRDVNRLVAIVAKDGRLSQAVNLLMTAREDGLFTEDEYYQAILKIRKWKSVAEALLFCIKSGDVKQFKSLACLYADEGKLDQALIACDCYLAKYDTSKIWVVKASVLANLDRKEEARGIYNKFLYDPEVGDKALCDLAFLEMRQGNKELAMELIAKVDTPPIESTHQWGVLMKMDGKHELAINKMWATLKSRMSDTLRKTILFSLGNILNDCGRFDEAYLSFKKGNRLKKAEYDRKREVKTLEGMKRIFNINDFAIAMKVARTDNNIVSPIFIIGMPRSGTSLVEQILSSHSKIKGKGELSCAGENTFICDSLTDLDAEAFDRAWGGYLECAKINSGYFTDKMPANYAMVGSLALMFPNAKFVNVQRNDDDLAVAIWTTDFASPHPYAYALGDIRFKAEAYKQYIDHWRSIGVDILDIKYEDVVTDTENAVNRMFEYIGLDVEEQCYSPHSSKRVVATASWAQVREPIHSKSIGRARNYPQLFNDHII